MNPAEKLSMTIDYLFGRGVSRALPLDRLGFEFSRRTGRIKRVYLEGRLIATLRPDGGLALSIHGAKMLAKHRNFAQNCVTVKEGVEEFVSQGRSVFAKHVVLCGRRIRPGAEVAVLDIRGKVIAVGRAILSAKMMKQFRSGIAVKIREGVRERSVGALHEQSL